MVCRPRRLPRQRYRNVLMHALSLVVVLGMQLPVGSRNHLRGFICFETQVEFPFSLGFIGLPQALVAEHQVVVRLQIFGINRKHGLQDLHGLGIFALQEKNASQIVERNTVTRILSQNDP